MLGVATSDGWAKAEVHAIVSLAMKYFKTGMYNFNKRVDFRDMQLSEG